jgi:hypothetical protein
MQTGATIAPTSSVLTRTAWDFSGFLSVISCGDHDFSCGDHHFSGAYRANTRSLPKFLCAGTKNTCGNGDFPRAWHKKSRGGSKNLCAAAEFSCGSLKNLCASPKYL